MVILIVTRRDVLWYVGAAGSGPRAFSAAGGTDHAGRRQDGRHQASRPSQVPRFSPTLLQYIVTNTSVL